MKGMLTYIPLLLTALSIFFGATQYARTQQQEFRKRYWEAQFTLYTDAAASAAAIATARNLEDVDKERKRFWQLYWGPLSAIEHPEVESAMARYGAVLAECEGGKKAHAHRRGQARRALRSGTPPSTWRTAFAPRSPRRGIPWTSAT